MGELKPDVDLQALNEWFADIPPGPYDALNTTGGWEVRQIDTDPANKHHWPFRLCSSITGQTAGCDAAVFSFIAGVINAWPHLLDAARTEGRGEGQPVAWAYEYTNHLKGDRAPGGWLRAVAFEAPTRARVNADFARNVQPLYASPIREPEISREDYRAQILSAVIGVLDQWHDGLRDRKAVEITDAILNLAPVGGRGEGWRPISEAPRDGSYILAHVADRDADDRWAHLAGRAFVVRHEGKTSSGYDLGWSVHPGFGGCADDWFSGWQPLPPLPQEQGGMK